MREIFLHIGAHRTGTTAMQAMLAEGRAALAGAGIAVLVPDDLRALPGFAGVPDKADPLVVKAALGVAIGTAPKLLLSEENLLGDMGWNLRSQSFYHRAGQRLAAYRDVLDGRVARIGLGIRGYESYWLSAYAYDLSYRNQRQNPLPRFQDIGTKLAEVERGWCNLVKDMRAVFPEAELMVWPAEARLPAPDLARQLIGQPALELPAPPPGVNAAPALGHIPAMEAKRAAEPGLSRKAMADWLSGRAVKRFDGFSPEASVRMALRYADDLAVLGAGFEGVELVTSSMENAV